MRVMQHGFLCASTLVASMWSCRESIKRSPTGSQASLTPSACSRATASSSIAAWIWSRRSNVLSMCLGCCVENKIYYNHLPGTLEFGANASSIQNQFIQMYRFSFQQGCANYFVSIISHPFFEERHSGCFNQGSFNVLKSKLRIFNDLEVDKCVFLIVSVMDYICNVL